MQRSHHSDRRLQGRDYASPPAINAKGKAEYQEFAQCTKKHARWTEVDEIRTLINDHMKMCPNTKVHIVGHSVGGTTALALAREERIYNV